MVADEDTKDSDTNDSAGNGNGNNETELERWQRNYMELLQELRVAQTGVQILFAFLLTLAFSGPVDEADAFAKGIYLVALLSAALAASFLIAPVAHHRVLFRRGRKPDLVKSTHRMTYCGLTLLLLSMVSSVMLALDTVLDRPVAVAVSFVVGVWFVLLWAVFPRSLR